MRRRRVQLPFAVRSRIMAAIHGRDTQAELALRRALWKLGARGFRVNARGLPGTPDILFPGRRVAIFVDGVFWHGHPIKYRRIMSRHWKERIKRNRAHDRKVNRSLARAGWNVLRFWDLDVLRDPPGAAKRVLAVFAGNHPTQRTWLFEHDPTRT